MRAAVALAGEETGVEPFGRRLADTLDDCNARGAQPGEPLPGRPRIGVGPARHDARDARGDQQVGARRPARRDMGARFEGDVRRRAARALARCRARRRERHRLAVRASAGLGPAAPDDATTADENAADARIGCRPSDAALGQGQRRAEPAGVIAHLVAGADCGATNPSGCNGLGRAASYASYCACALVRAGPLSVAM